MPGLNSVSCGDSYDSTVPAASIEDVWNARGGWFTVSNNDAFVELEYGALGASYFEDEQRMPAGSSATLPPNAKGVRFRNANPGKAALISGFIAQGDEPILNLLSVGATVSLSPPLNLGTGDPEQLFAATVGSLGDWRLGTQASPDTSLNPAFKVTRTVSVADAAVAGAAPEQLATVYGIGFGTTNCGKQPVGVLGVGITQSTTAGPNNDSLGVMGFGQTLTGATGSPEGGFFAARRNSGATGAAAGVEVQVQNYTSADSYNPAGYSNSTVIDCHNSQDAAAFRVGVGIGFNLNTAGLPLIDVGIGVPSNNGGLIRTAVLRDDGNSTHGIVINGTKAGYGIDLQGGTFGRPFRLPNNQSMVARNAAGTGDVLMFSVSASDTLVAQSQLTLFAGAFVSAGQGIATDTVTGMTIGTATTQKIGFWSKTPVVQQQLSTGAGHTVDDVITFLQLIGLCHQ